MQSFLKVLFLDSIVCLSGCYDGIYIFFALMGSRIEGVQTFERGEGGRGGGLKNLYIFGCAPVKV